MSYANVCTNTAQSQAQKSLRMRNTIAQFQCVEWTSDRQAKIDRQYGHTHMTSIFFNSNQCLISIGWRSIIYECLAACWNGSCDKCHTYSSLKFAISYIELNALHERTDTYMYRIYIIIIIMIVIIVQYSIHRYVVEIGHKSNEHSTCISSEKKTYEEQAKSEGKNPNWKKINNKFTSTLSVAR